MFIAGSSALWKFRFMLLAPTQTTRLKCTERSEMDTYGEDFGQTSWGNNGRVTGNPSSVDGSRLLGGLDDVNRLIEILIVIGGHLSDQVGGCARPRDVR